MTGGGVLIAFEGGEGSGKSTQAALLAAKIGAVLTREPGGTPIGRRMRSIVLDPAVTDLDRRAEALLMLADRAQHVAEVIRPALARGDDVVTDRFSASTFAYQGWGRGLGLEDLKHLSWWAAAGVDADLVVLLDVPPEVAAVRRGEVPDRMEQAGIDFHRRVDEGYRVMAAAEPGRWVVVDGTGTPEEAAELVHDAYLRWRAQLRG